jgi:hypothetical protein
MKSPSDFDRSRPPPDLRQVQVLITTIENYYAEPKNSDPRCFVKMYTREGFKMPGDNFKSVFGDEVWDEAQRQCLEAGWNAYFEEERKYFVVKRA